MRGIKIIGGLFCALFWLYFCGTAVAQEREGGSEELDLYATAAVLLDADSGRVLYGKNAQEPMAMASTTKIMTCILVLEKGHLEDVVSVSSYAASMPKVKLYVHTGEEYQVKDLLCSLMLESHNDSAVVLAEYVGGLALAEDASDMAAHTAQESREAVAAFAEIMNEKAAELGCEDTWFITPNGLDATETVSLQGGAEMQMEHHTTAAELARIMAYCIGQSPEREEFLQITRRASHSFSANGRSFSCTNHNAFLTMMEGALSGKTGFTNKAGYCYVGALESEGRTFVVALLACGWPNNKSYKWSDTRKLMEYGTEQYFFRELAQGKEELVEGNLPELVVEKGQTSVLGDTACVEVLRSREGVGAQELLLRADEKVEVKLQIQKSLRAPVAAGQEVGRVLYSVDNVVYRREELVAGRDVECITPGWCAAQILERFLLN